MSIRNKRRLLGASLLLVVAIAPFIFSQTARSYASWVGDFLKANMFVDGRNVTFGSAAKTSNVTITGDLAVDGTASVDSIASDGTISLLSSGDPTSVYPAVQVGYSTNIAVNENIFLPLMALNGADNLTTFGYIQASPSNITDGTEESALYLGLMHNGVPTASLAMAGGTVASYSTGAYAYQFISTNGQISTWGTAPRYSGMVDDSAGNEFNAIDIVTTINDTTNGSEDSTVALKNFVAGAATTQISFGASGVTLPTTSHEYQFVDAKLGTTAGWDTRGANNIWHTTCPASQSGSTLVIPIQLRIGQTITAFKVVGQIESAGNTVTLDADLRKTTTAAADLTDSSVGAITQISVTSDTAVATSKTSLNDTVAATEAFYVLLTATTGASTDIDLQGVTVTVTEN